MTKIKHPYTLEDLVGKGKLAEQDSQVLSLGFAINPSLSYDSNFVVDSDSEKSIRKKFVGKAGALFDLIEYFGQVEENRGNMSALDDLVSVILPYVLDRSIKDKKEMANHKRQMVNGLKNNPSLALSKADELIKMGVIYMARFIENNRDEIFDRMSTDQLYSIFSKSPAYRNGNPSHDRVADLKEKIQKMQEASKNGSGMSSVIKKELSELVKKIPQEQQAFLKICPRMEESLTDSISSLIQREYQGLFTDKKGKLVKYKVRNYLEDNYAVPESLMQDDDRPFGEQYDLWDKNLKPAYLAVAQTFYGPEKKRAKIDKDEDKEKRKSEAGKLGVRT
jgi:hypothetical protein